MRRAAFQCQRRFAVPTEAVAGKLLFAVEIPVRWGDQDANNHVNNVSYFRYLEEARVQWMLHHDVLSGEFKPVAVTLGATFLKSAEYPASLWVTVELGEVGKRSISLTHRILDADDRGLCYAEGYAKLVWTDPATGKSVPLPPSLLQRLGLEAQSGQ
jgi:acyl-CoA thioester hydrolase